MAEGVFTWFLVLGGACQSFTLNHVHDRKFFFDRLRLFTLFLV